MGDENPSALDVSAHPHFLETVWLLPHDLLLLCTGADETVQGGLLLLCERRRGSEHQGGVPAVGRGLGEAWAALRNPAALAAVPVPGGDDGGVDRDDGVGDGHGRGGAGARLQQQRARAAVLPGVLPAGQPAGAELLRQPVAVQLQAHQGARDRRVADLPPRAHVAQHQAPDPPPHSHQTTPPTRELIPKKSVPLL